MIKTAFILSFLVVVGAILLLRGLGDDSLGFPDADRILMDGVFIRDFLVDLPLAAPYVYPVNYFGQYPALSIGYRPPFFPFVEALFNLVFGVNAWSSRLALFAFAAAGITAWFLIVRRIYNIPLAVLSILVWLSTPFYAQWGWYTMAEVPVVSMSLITAYFFCRYIDTGAVRHIFLTTIFFGLAAWTKQTAVYMGLWFLLYLLTTGKAVDFFRQKAVWASVIVMILILVPLAVMTISFGKMNLYQSIGEMPDNRAARFSWENWSIHLKNLYSLHLTAPVAILGVVGAAMAVYYRDKKALFFATGIISVYVFFSLMVGKNFRYPIFWIPLISVIAVLPIFYLYKNKNFRIEFSSIIITVFVYQVYLVFDRQPSYAKGYKEAAKFVPCLSGCHPYPLHLGCSQSPE